MTLALNKKLRKEWLYPYLFIMPQPTRAKPFGIPFVWFGRIRGGIGWILVADVFYNSRFIWAGVAGVMVFISLDELLPSAEKYGKHHLSIYVLIAGMAVMAVSLLLFL